MYLNEIKRKKIKVIVIKALLRIVKIQQQPTCLKIEWLSNCGITMERII